MKTLKKISSAMTLSDPIAAINVAKKIVDSDSRNYKRKMYIARTKYGWKVLAPKYKAAYGDKIVGEYGSVLV